jgi:hypothetical protein
MIRGVPALYNTLNKRDLTIGVWIDLLGPYIRTNNSRRNDDE